MKFLEAFCAYMEGIAKLIKMWFSGVGGVLIAVGICACFCDPAIAVEKVAHVIKSGVFFAAVGLFLPVEETWFHWRIMLERRNERD